MLGEFIDFVKERSLFDKTDKVLLAVSGGTDSMVMAHLFIKAGYHAGLAHCNFGLRGTESDDDEKLVSSFAQQNKIPFFSRKFKTLQYADTHRVSIQVAARELRYRWFEELRSKHGYDRIATAHHKDDVVETFLINLSRGTGISGLHGIPVINGKIVRPLLFAWREEVEQYATKNNVRFREDSSNRSLKYTRNKIRHEIIPAMEKIDPSFREQVVSTAEKIAETELVYNGLLEEKKKELVRREGEEYRIAKEPLRALKINRTFIFGLFSDFGVNSDMAENILAGLDGIPGRSFLTPGYEILVDREDIIVRARRDEKSAESEELEISIPKGTKEISEPINLRFSEVPVSGMTISKDPGTAHLDLDKIQFPLTLRHWKRGDAFIPLGMEGMKKLSDFFIDEKLSKFDKENIWILCSGEDVAWVIGHRIDHRFRITSATRRVLVIKEV